MGPMRSCDELFEECSCSTCASRSTAGRISTARFSQNNRESIFGRKMKKMEGNRRFTHVVKKRINLVQDRKMPIVYQ